jgi:hypothetical protein
MMRRREKVFFPFNACLPLHIQTKSLQQNESCRKDEKAHAIQRFHMQFRAPIASSSRKNLAIGLVINGQYGTR